MMGQGNWHGSWAPLSVAVRTDRYEGRKWSHVLSWQPGASNAPSEAPKVRAPSRLPTTSPHAPSMTTKFRKMRCATIMLSGIQLNGSFKLGSPACQIFPVLQALSADQRSAIDAVYLAAVCDVSPVLPPPWKLTSTHLDLQADMSPCASAPPYPQIAPNCDNASNPLVLHLPSVDCNGMLLIAQRLRQEDIRLKGHASKARRHQISRQYMIKFYDLHGRPVIMAV